MQRVRKFLIAQEASPTGRIPTESALRSAVATQGWHKTWDAAIELMADAKKTEECGAFVVIADQDLSLAVAVFSRQKLEPLDGETKWTSVKIAKGDGFWCNFNNSDYGWGWVSGAEREVPFRVRYIQPKAKPKRSNFLSRSRAWVSDLLRGRNKKTG